MAKKLYLLDGMALVYRAHFALIARPIFTSKGVNTSALYGFTQTLLDITKNQQPTHLAVAFDTDVPTQRHHEFPEYKATRETMPEDLSAALPHVRRLLEAFTNLHGAALIVTGRHVDDLIDNPPPGAGKKQVDAAVSDAERRLYAGLETGRCAGPRPHSAASGAWSEHLSCLA